MKSLGQLECTLHFVTDVSNITMGTLVWGLGLLIGNRTGNGCGDLQVHPVRAPTLRETLYTRDSILRLVWVPAKKRRNLASLWSCNVVGLYDANVNVNLLKKPEMKNCADLYDGLLLHLLHHLLLAVSLTRLRLGWVNACHVVSVIWTVTMVTTTEGEEARMCGSDA